MKFKYFSLLIIVLLAGAYEGTCTTAPPVHRLEVCEALPFTVISEVVLPVILPAPAVSVKVCDVRIAEKKSETALFCRSHLSDYVHRYDYESKPTLTGIYSSYKSIVIQSRNEINIRSPNWI